MALRDADVMRHPNDPALARLRRKANQAWDMAGCARQDGDKADETRHTEEARRYEDEIREHLASVAPPASVCNGCRHPVQYHFTRCVVVGCACTKQFHRSVS